jgi:nucleoside-diphosphate-sugar epimerase
MDLRTSLVLVTGATTPAGRRLIEALLHGLPGQPDLAPAPALRVRCLALPGEDHAALRALSDRVQILVGDLRQPANAARLCHGAKGAVLFHLAIARERPLVRQLRQINVDATAGLLEAAAKAGVRRAVVLSDAAVCAGATNGQPLDEAAPVQPASAFGRIMQAREAAVRAAKDLETVLLRCAPVIGGSVDGLRPLWFNLALAGQLPLQPAAGAKLSLASPDVVAGACLRAAAVRQAAGELYWIADEPPHDLAALCQAVRQLAEKELPAALASGLPGRGSVPLKALAARLLPLLGFSCAAGEAALTAARPLVVSAAKAASQLGLRSTARCEDELRALLLTVPPVIPERPKAEEPPQESAAGES